MTTTPGPRSLGRGIVIPAGTDPPAPWASTPRVRIATDVLGDGDRRAALIDRLQRTWVRREPVVVEWALDDEALAAREVDERPVWSVPVDFLFPLERLRFLVFSNNYDARHGAPRWWWATKAARSVGAVPGGDADVVLPGGTPAWIDGGPRQPLPPVDVPVIHGETIEAGRIDAVPDVDRIGPVEGLAADQLDAVHHRAGPARVIAPAGSGKTRTLGARLRHLIDTLGAEPRFVMAVAYNTKAADQLRARVGADRSTVRTIHSLGWAILTEAQPDLDLVDELEVRAEFERLVSVPRRANADPIGPYLEALDDVRAALRDPRLVEASRDDVAGFAEAFERYRDRMYRRRRVDHGEQIYGAIEALLGDPALRARWQRRCRHLLVDEFQDLTPAYLLLLRLVAAPELDAFGVGDDDQVIYGYAGADPGFLIDFDAYFPGAAHHALTRNYRCPADVVDGAATLLSYNRRRIDKMIEPVKTSVGLEVVTHDGADLANVAADLVERRIAEGARPDEVAVLARVNSTLIPIKAALVERDIPTNDLLDGGSLRRTTVRALLAWIRIALEPDRIDRNTVLATVRRPARGLTTLARELLTRSRYDLDDLHDIGDRLDGKQAARWAAYIADLQAAGTIARTDDAPELLAFLIDEVGLGASARTLDSGRSNASRSGHVDDLVAVRRAGALHPTLVDLVPWLRTALDRPPQADGVTLSSVHRVKGMEWPTVIVFGADRGAMPHALATDIEEERRIFHVAITRAIDTAVVLADAARPSRFLAELHGTAPKASAEPITAPAPMPLPTTLVVGATVRLRGGYEGTIVEIGTERVTIELPTGAEVDVDIPEIVEVFPPAAPDAELVERLRRWRLDTSRRLGVPAYIVFNDRTLEAIAASRPADERALLAVPGIGEKKLEAYGDEILSIVATSA